MTLVAVKALPEKIKGEYKSAIPVLKEFMNMNTRYARIEFAMYEYSDTVSARGSIERQAKIYNLPIKVLNRNGECYLKRTDI